MVITHTDRNFALGKANKLLFIIAAIVMSVILRPTFASAQDDASISFEKQLYEWGEEGRVTYSIPDWDGDPDVKVSAVRNSRNVKPPSTGRMSFAAHPGDEGQLEFYGGDPSRGRLKAAVNAFWISGPAFKEWAAEALFAHRFSPELGALQIQGGVYQDAGAEVKVAVVGNDAIMEKYKRYGACSVDFIRLGRIHPGGARQLDKTVRQITLEKGREIYGFTPELTQMETTYTDTPFDQLLKSIGPYSVRLNCFGAEFAYENFHVRIPQGFKVIVPKEDGIEIDDPDDSYFGGVQPVEYNIPITPPPGISSGDVRVLTPEERENLPAEFLTEYDKMIAESRSTTGLDIRADTETAAPSQTTTIDSPEEFEFYIEFPNRITETIREHLSVKVFKIFNENQNRVVETINLANFKSNDEIEALKTTAGYAGSLTPDILECGMGCLRTRVQHPFTNGGLHQAGDYEIRVYLNGFYILDSRRVTIGAKDDDPDVSQIGREISIPVEFGSYSIDVKPLSQNAQAPYLTSSMVRVNIKPREDAEQNLRIENLHLSVHHREGYTYGCQAYAATESRRLQTIALKGESLSLLLPSEAGNYELRLYANSPSNDFDNIGLLEFGDLVAVLPMRVETPYGKIKINNKSDQHFTTGVGIPWVQIQPKINQPNDRFVRNAESNKLDAPISIFGIYNMGQKMAGGVDLMPPTYNPRTTFTDSVQTTRLGGAETDRNPVYISNHFDRPYYEFRLSQAGLYYDRVPFTAHNTFVPEWPSVIKNQKSSISDWIEDDNPLRREAAWLMNIDECANYVPTEKPQIKMTKWHMPVTNIVAGTPNSSDDDQDGPPLPEGYFVEINSIFYGHPFYLEAHFTKPQPHSVYKANVGEYLNVKMTQTKNNPLLYRSAAITLTHEN